MRKILIAALLLILMSCTAFALDENTEPSEQPFEVQNSEEPDPVATDYDMDKVVMTLTETVYYKTGAPIEPVPVMTYEGETIPTEDYSLEYSNNTNVGTATITAVFSEDKNKSVNFEIVPAKPAVAAITKVASSKPNVTVTWNKVSCTAYELQVSSNNSFMNAAIYKQAATSKTMANMVNDRTYHFRVRAYNTESGKTTYGDWSTYSSKVHTTGEVGNKYCINGAFIKDRTVKVGANYYYYNTSGIKCACSKIMWNKIKNKKSGTKYLIAIDCDKNRVCIYKGKKGKWKLKSYWKCDTGAYDTPTIKGKFKVSGKVSHFGEEKGYSVWYATRIKYEYYIHSTLYQPYSKTQNRDSRLGKNISHGCVRLAISNAKWVYKNCKKGTRIIIY